MPPISNSKRSKPTRKYLGDPPLPWYNSGIQLYYLPPAHGLEFEPCSEVLSLIEYWLPIRKKPEIEDQYTFYLVENLLCIDMCCFTVDKNISQAELVRLTFYNAEISCAGTTLERALPHIKPPLPNEELNDPFFEGVLSPSQVRQLIDLKDIHRQPYSKSLFAINIDRSEIKPEEAIEEIVATFNRFGLSLVEFRTMRMPGSIRSVLLLFPSIMAARYALNAVPWPNSKLVFQPLDKERALKPCQTLYFPDSQGLTFETAKELFACCSSFKVVDFLQKGKGMFIEFDSKVNITYLLQSVPFVFFKGKKYDMHCQEYFPAIYKARKPDSHKLFFKIKPYQADELLQNAFSAYEPLEISQAHQKNQVLGSVVFATEEACRYAFYEALERFPMEFSYLRPYGQSQFSGQYQYQVASAPNLQPIYQQIPQPAPQPIYWQIPQPIPQPIYGQIPQPVPYPIAQPVPYPVSKPIPYPIAQPLPEQPPKNPQDEMEDNFEASLNAAQAREAESHDPRSQLQMEYFNLKNFAKSQAASEEEATCLALHPQPQEIQEKAVA